MFLLFCFKNVFSSLSFLKDTFPVHRLFGWQLISFSTLNVLFVVRLSGFAAAIVVKSLLMGTPLKINFLFLVFKNFSCYTWCSVVSLWCDTTRCIFPLVKSIWNWSSFFKCAVCFISSEKLFFITSLNIKYTLCSLLGFLKFQTYVKPPHSISKFLNCFFTCCILQNFPVHWFSFPLYLVGFKTLNLSFNFITFFIYGISFSFLSDLLDHFLKFPFSPDIFKLVLLCLEMY